MYRHIKKYELKYTDVDAYDNLKMSTLLSFMEESACLSADELGFGYKDIAPKNIGFIVVNYYVELYKDIKLGDELTVHTWPLKPKHIVFLRDYELYCGNEKVGVATARWGMIDLKNFTLLPSATFFSESDLEGYNTERSIDFNGWKIPRIAGGDKVYSKKVAYSDCDHYFHVNNTKYADFLMDVFSLEELENKSVQSFQITYNKQCLSGEVIDFSKKCEGDFWLIEGSVESELRIQMRIKFNAI